MGKRGATKRAAQSAGGPAVAKEPSKAAENEEWAWMVDEDPAFYLEEAAPGKRAG